MRHKYYYKYKTGIGIPTHDPCVTQEFTPASHVKANEDHWTDVFVAASSRSWGEAALKAAEMGDTDALLVALNMEGADMDHQVVAGKGFPDNDHWFGGHGWKDNDAGYQPRAQDGDTLMHVACRSRSALLTRLLLAMGANHEIQNAEGKYARQCTDCPYIERHFCQMVRKVGWVSDYACLMDDGHEKGEWLGGDEWRPAEFGFGWNRSEKPAYLSKEKVEGQPYMLPWSPHRDNSFHLQVGNKTMAPKARLG